MCEAAFDFLQWQQPTREKKKKKKKKRGKKKGKKTVLDYTAIPFTRAEKNAGGGICQDDIRGVMQLICGQESCITGSYAACI